VRELGEWLEDQRLGATLEVVTRRVAGRFVSEHLLPSGRHLRTVTKTIHTLSQKRDHVPTDGPSPWTGQAPAKVPHLGGTGDDEERPFTADELRLLLANPPDQTMADFILVAALTGMRREEIGRLTVADCANGVFIVRSGKTAAARRRVPIHSALTEVVARRTNGKASGAYLFDELRSQHTERTDPLGKAFARYRRSLGLQEGNGRRSRINLHSLRRFFVTTAINAGQPPHVVSLVVGHAEGRKGMTLSRYWAGSEDAALRGVVEAVRLP
jgi:integrase